MKPRLTINIEPNDAPYIVVDPASIVNIYRQKDFDSQLRFIHSTNVTPRGTAYSLAPSVLARRGSYSCSLPAEEYPEPIEFSNLANSIPGYIPKTDCEPVKINDYMRTKSNSSIFFQFPQVESPTQPSYQESILKELLTQCGTQIQLYCRMCDDSEASYPTGLLDLIKIIENKNNLSLKEQAEQLSTTSQAALAKGKPKKVKTFCDYISCSQQKDIDIFPLYHFIVDNYNNHFLQNNVMDNKRINL